ncbi:MAG: T9SS type A sorting domain-containing protein [Lewinellaceae bacterium]|nr:T9SS type A sorting domain-containing protein [Lewinellaceae bacterium]
MERTNFTFVSTFNWLKALSLLMVFGFAGAHQAYAQPQLMVADAAGQVPAPVITKVLPEGQCAYQFQWTVFVFDPANPFAATADAYISTSTTSTSVTPDATLMLMGGGGTYVLDVIAAVGTNTLTIRKDGPSGSVTQTYTIIVDDVREPQIYGPGNMVIEVPSCDPDGVPVNWTVSTVDDCDLAPILAHTGGPGSGSLLSPAGSPYTVSYTSTDDDGNVAYYSFTITVNQAPDPAPIVDVSGNGQFSIPACQSSASVFFTGNVYDCGISPNDNLTGQITVSGAPLTVVYIQEEDGFAFFEAVGNLTPGIYPIDVSYGGVTVQTLFTVVQEADQLPDITMPGNLTYLLPACTNQMTGRFAITVTDDCDPSISLNRLHFTYTNANGTTTLTPLAGYDLAQGYFEFERILTEDDDGAVITANYTDIAGNFRQVDATLQVVSQPDTWAPLIIYPSQDINVTLDPCDPDPAVVFFEVTVTDNCDGDYVPGPVVVPGSEFTVTITPTPNGSTVLSSPGGETFVAVVNPGTYQVLITATDAAGNTREEDFFIVVTQDPPPPTNLVCTDDVNVTLDANCQRLITADMVLEGSFGCADPADFLVNIATDDDPTNGPILDGCGQFIYEVTYVGPGPSVTGNPQGPGATSAYTGFANGTPFAEANWTVSFPDPNSPGVYAFTDDMLTLTSGADDGVAVAIPMPRDGQLTFDYNYQIETVGGLLDMALIDLNSNTIVDLSFPAGNVNTGSGMVDQAVQQGWVLMILLQGDGFQSLGNDSFVEVTNFQLQFGDDSNGPTFPFFNWEDCWGYVTGEDKAAPDLECPDDTNIGTVTREAHVLSGSLDTGDDQLNLTNYSCFIDGSGTQAGPHYYELTEFQVSEEDYYTFYLDHAFNSDGFVAMYQGSFDPSNPCQNIIAQVDDNFLLIQGLFLGLLNQGPVGGIFDPVVRISLPLRPYETYYILTSTKDANDTGDYEWVVFSDNGGWLGEWNIYVDVDPVTWEETPVEEFISFPTEQRTFAIELFCGDFDLIYNNPASLSITGNPIVSDNCDNNVDVSFVDTYSANGDCVPIVITRTFTAVDDKGNTSTCTQEITLSLPDINDIQMPPFTAPLECDEDFPLDANGHPAPSATGYPSIFTVAGIYNLEDSYCSIGADYSDGPEINVCDGTYKFTRTWDILNWCDPLNAGSGFLHWDQIVKVGDFTAPEVTCPGEDTDWDGIPDQGLTFSTSPWSCTGSFSVPVLNDDNVTDNCSGWSYTTEIVTEVEVEVTNQYGQVTGTRIDTVVVRTNAMITQRADRLVTGIPQGNHYFRYTVEDDCGNKVVEYCPFSVKDLIEPTAICDDELIISIGGGDDSYAGVLPNVRARVYAEAINENATDNCGVDRIEVRRDHFNPILYTCGNTFSNWGPYVDFFCCDVGVTITIELRVFDEAGNVNTCWLEVTPEEKARPYCYAPHPVSVDCDDLPYNFDPADLDQLNDLFGEATGEDNCGVASITSFSSPNLECGYGYIDRNFRVTDINGNQSSNPCTQRVTINEVHNFEIHFPGDENNFMCGDGVAPDSVKYTEIGCDLLAVSHTDEEFTATTGNECYKIFRTWKVVNWCQYDGESDPFIVGRDEDCDGNPGYTLTPNGVDDGDGSCVWVLHRPGGYTYIDKDNDESPNNNIPRSFENHCLFIDDFWRKEEYAGGFYQYTQIIKVHDNERPEIDGDAQEFCSYDNVDCDGIVGLPFTITEDCTPGDLTIDVFLDAGADGNPANDIDLRDLTDGLFDDFELTGDYPDYQINGRFPIGDHAFIVYVEDGCGNTNSASLPFSVIDCKEPAPVCIYGLSTELMPVDLDGDDVPDASQMAIWASDFVASPIMDCTGPVEFSINRPGEVPDITSTSLLLDCSDVILGAGLVNIEIWAWDGQGNSDFCETYIQVLDVNDPQYCSDSLVVGAAGAIATEEALAVENVEVTLSGQASQSMTTAADGEYEFAGLQEGYDYTITPQLNANYLNGVSTFDLVLISKHILGVQPLGSPYKMIAADVNNSRSITTLDLIQLRKLILSIDTEFENNTSWRFVEEAYVFPNIANPWFEEFPEVVNINNLPGTGISGADFVAVKIGDVNGDAQANALAGIEGRTMAGTFALNVADAEVKAGNEYTVEFTAADIASIDGYQATLTFDNSALELVDIINGVATEENFGLAYVNEGLITTSWNGKATAGEALFSLVFRATADAQLSELLNVSSRITKAEAYKTNGDYMDVAVTFSGKEVASAGFELYQNTPNPFKGETLIGFNLPADDSVTLTISDVTGRVLRLVRLDGVKGYNNVVVNSNDLPAAGVLYYTVETAEYTATKKMIIIE